MSYSDEPSLTPGQKLGCLGFGLLMLGLNVYLLFPYFLPGDCEPDVECKAMGVLGLLPLFSLLAGALLIWWMMRDGKDKQ